MTRLATTESSVAHDKAGCAKASACDSAHNWLITRATTSIARKIEAPCCSRQRRGDSTLGAHKTRSGGAHDMDVRSTE